jgi:hypothetical protein
LSAGEFGIKFNDTRGGSGGNLGKFGKKYWKKPVKIG